MSATIEAIQFCRLVHCYMSGSKSIATISDAIGNDASKLLAAYTVAVRSDGGTQAGRRFMDALRGHREAVR